MAQSISFHRSNIRIIVLFVVLFCITTTISAQIGKKNVTLQMEETPLIEVFNSISSQTGFRFAYNPNVLDENARINVDVTKQDLDTVLVLILPHSVRYKKISDYIILTSIENTNETKIDSLPLNNVKDIVAISDTVYIYNENDTVLNLLKEIKQDLNELKAQRLSEPKGSWIISISSGLRSEICFATSYSRTFWNNQKISFPSLEFAFGYLFKNRLQIETGIKYTQNYADYSFEAFNWGGNTIVDERHLLYSSLNIPLAMKYYVPLGKNGFNFFIKAGIDFSIPIEKNSIEILEGENNLVDVFSWQSSSGAEIQTLHTLYYSTIVETPLRKMNILLNLGTGFSYQFKFGLGLAIYGEYLAGVTNTARISIPYRQEQFNYISNTWEFYNEGTEYVTFRGDYWNAGLTISYKFKN